MNGAPPSQPQEQVLYARLLDWGTRLGLLVLRGRLQLSGGTLKRQLGRGPLCRCLLLSQAARGFLSHESYRRGRGEQSDLVCWRVSTRRASCCGI